ncbi:fumarylacetoacetate hydrolase family protein [Mesorhizobium sp. M0809]|uniref:2-keto-4-pentenoate hydratase n=1 Tax=Mesorhizobium sp. M0809 TaxID=2957003 RepID=UPI00333CC302
MEHYSRRYIMSNSAYDGIALANKLLGALRGGERVAAHADTLGNLTRVQALEVQTNILRGLGTAVSGWKVSLLPDGDLVSAPIVAERVFRSSADVGGSQYGWAGVESEIAFRLARSPGGSARVITRDEVIDSVEGACAAIEVCQSRWSSTVTPPRNAMVADLLANGALIVGPLEKEWQHLDFSRVNARLRINDKTIRESPGRADGDLIDLVVRLANDLRSRGMKLEAGQVITTGSYTGLYPVVTGDRIAVEFDRIAPVTATLKP